MRHRLRPDRPERARLSRGERGEAQWSCTGHRGPSRDVAEGSVTAEEALECMGRELGVY